MIKSKIFIFVVLISYSSTLMALSQESYFNQNIKLAIRTFCSKPGSILSEVLGSLFRIFEEIGFDHNDKILSVGTYSDCHPLIVAAIYGAQVDVAQSDIYKSDLSVVPQNERLRSSIDEIREVFKHNIGYDPIGDRIKVGKYNDIDEEETLPTNYYNKIFLFEVFDPTNPSFFTDAVVFMSAILDTLQNGGTILFSTMNPGDDLLMIERIKDIASNKGMEVVQYGKHSQHRVMDTRIIHEIRILKNERRIRDINHQISL